eukprot:1393263-Amorphochlora_amoeboformis.AAC.2
MRHSFVVIFIHLNNEITLPRCIRIDDFRACSLGSCQPLAQDLELPVWQTRHKSYVPRTGRQKSRSGVLHPFRRSRCPPFLSKARHAPENKPSWASQCIKSESNRRQRYSSFAFQRLLSKPHAHPVEISTA